VQLRCNERKKHWGVFLLAFLDEVQEPVRHSVRRGKERRGLVKIFSRSPGKRAEVNLTTLVLEVEKKERGGWLLFAKEKSIRFGGQ